MSSGMYYVPEGKATSVVKKGEFRFSAVGLDHGHIYGMTQGLLDAGGELARVYDPDSAKVDRFRSKFPEAKPARTEEEALEDPRIHLVATACVPADRGPLGLRVQAAGLHFFSDKSPFTTLEHLARARESVKKTGKKWLVYYSERIQNEASVIAGEMVHGGAIGKVVQVLGLGPHRANAKERPDWFFKKAKYGGILCDIGSHQIEQFLYFASAKSATITHAVAANRANPEYPELEDFGEASLVADTGVYNYFRVDWLTPNGLKTWGDGRLFIVGTGGYIEVRKYVDVARDNSENHLYIVDGSSERYVPANGTRGFPYFGQLILDCLNDTDTAMPQDHTFLAAELCMKAQAIADSAKN